MAAIAALTAVLEVMIDMSQNGRKDIFGILIVALLGAAGGALITFMVQIKDNRLAPLYTDFDAKFNQVKFGDTKETVLMLLGKPTRIWPSDPQHTNDKKTEFDSFSGATIGLTEIWDYDVAERTYIVFFGPNPKWNDEIRVTGKHPNSERAPLTNRMHLDAKSRADLCFANIVGKLSSAKVLVGFWRS